jgi:hypothetical protein
MIAYEFLMSAMDFERRLERSNFSSIQADETFRLPSFGYFLPKRRRGRPILEDIALLFKSDYF